MLGLETLDVLIGLVTVYLVFGIACTAIVEAVASFWGLRSANLEKALREFFAGDLKEKTPFVTAFYAHPLIRALSKGDKGRPSYIPPEIVGQVVQGLLTAGGAATSLAEAVKALPGTPESNRVKGVLNLFVSEARGDAAAFRDLVKTHFDATMERAAGWFKRHAQVITLVASSILVIAANVDTVDIARSLASSPAARVKLVEIAGQNLKNAEALRDQAKTAQGENPDAVKQAQNKVAAALGALEKAEADMTSAGLPFGWNGFASRAGFRDWLAKVAGLMVSIFAVSLGAPFWFDVLQKFMQVRGAGTTPKTPKPQEGKP
jgi:hypothetical protein